MNRVPSPHNRYTKDPIYIPSLRPAPGKLAADESATRVRLDCRSISGYRYQALPHGPVPVNYELHLGALVSAGLLQRSIDPTHTRSTDGAPVIKYTPAKPADLNIFSPSERTTLTSVFERFGYKKSKEVEDLSHEERAWLDNQAGYALINYQQYAFDLKDV